MSATSHAAVESGAALIAKAAPPVSVSLATITGGVVRVQASSSPLHIAVINGIITDAANGQAYFPLTVAVTGIVQKLFFEVWATDANGETYPNQSGKFDYYGQLEVRQKCISQ